MASAISAWRALAQAWRWAVGSDGSEPWTDVWSRVEKKYKRRATILLTIDLLLFAGLCLFAYWLRTGRYLPVDLSEYSTLLYRNLAATGPDRLSMTELLLGPISVERVPLQLVIFSLLMASLVSIPVLVAILYRFPFALPFVGMVAFVAVMPYLAITILLGAAVASLRPLRMSFRFGSSLLALAPIGLYFWLAVRAGSEATAGGTPIEQFKFYAPWVLSLLAACFNFAVVLSIASLVGYRPGAIAPILAILFALPVGLFEAKVGQDELYYSILEARYGPASRDCFRAEDISAFLEERPDLLRPYVDRFGGSREAIGEIRWQWKLGLASVRPLKREVERQALKELQRDREEAVYYIERFVEDFPNSRRVPAALYLQGRALDMRLDRVRLREDGWITFNDDFPGQASGPIWRSLVGSYGDHPLSAVARYKMAVQIGRTGRIDEAIALLRAIRVVAEAQRKRRAAPPRGAFAWLVRPAAEQEALGVDLYEIALEARKLLEFLEANGRDPKYGTRPVAALLRMNPRHPLYPENLRLLKERCPGSLLEDNIELLLVLTHRSVSRRIDLLSEHIKTYEQQDSTARAAYELARLLEGDARFEEATVIYEALAREHPRSVWTELAQQRIAVLKLRLGK